MALDSTHFGAFDLHLFTQYHVRYGGRGVLISWHGDKKSVAVHSQLISGTASEVAAMIEGAIRHGTDMQGEANYVDSHGQSEIGFGLTGASASTCYRDLNASTSPSSACPTPTRAASSPTWPRCSRGAHRWRAGRFSFGGLGAPER